MKIINTKSTAATLILAASVIPAFGQFRGHGSDHGFERSGRPQFEQQRSSQAPAGQRNSQRGDSFRNRAVPQFEQRYQPQYQQRQFAQPQPTYRPRSNWQQPAPRADARQYGGNTYRGDNGARYEYNSRGHGFGRSYRYVIPQNRFYSSFGRDHFFRIGRPVLYGRYPRFQYGGFWFNFVSAPPAYWGPDWYDTDDVYIDYSDGGYYLFDNRYPGQGIPLEVDNGDAWGAQPDGTYDNTYSGTYGGPYGNGSGGSYPGPY
jgi:hypothetical protein